MYGFCVQILTEIYESRQLLPGHFHFFRISNTTTGARLFWFFFFLVFFFLVLVFFFVVRFGDFFFVSMVEA